MSELRPLASGWLGADGVMRIHDADGKETHAIRRETGESDDSFARRVLEEMGWHVAWEPTPR